LSEPLVEELIRRAFHQASAMRANEEISRMRETQPPGVTDEALSYEVLLPAEGERAFLIENVLPRLVYFLDCRGGRSSQAEGVFISLFAGEQLYFVQLSEFFETLGPAAGLSFEEMVHRWGEARGI
jgi:hypothetical protein